MDINIIISLVTGLGFGSILTALASYFLDKKKETYLNLAKILEDKYRMLLIFMACALDIEKKKYFTINEQVAKTNSKDYMNQIREYYYHSTLYSSDEVILSLKEFINTPSQEAYIKVAQSMRKDLWGKKTKIDFNDINLDNKNTPNPPTPLNFYLKKFLKYPYLIYVYLTHMARKLYF